MVEIQKVAQIEAKVGDAVSTKKEEVIQPEEKQLTTCIIPKAGHENVGHMCFNTLAEVVQDKDKKKLPQKWFRNYELYRARHWKSQGAAKLSTVNLIWNYIQRTVNLLTDNNPTFDIAAEDDKMASILHKAARYWWNEEEQQEVFADSVEMSEINGCVIEKVVFNPSLKNGIGEVDTITIDPHNFGFWPLNEKRAKRWEAALHFYTIPVNQARRMWPSMAPYIKSDEGWKKDLGEGRREIFGGTTSDKGVKEYGDWGVDHATFTGNIESLGKIMGDKENVLILEFWVKDYSTKTKVITESTSRLDEVSGEHVAVPQVTEQFPKYPGNIRCITVCNGGDVVLSDRPNPSINPTLPTHLASQTYLWSMFPFSIAQSNKDIVSPWGFSSIEQLETLNFEVDKCLSQLNIVKDKAVRSPVINPRNAQVPNSAFTNAPAQVINPKDHVVAAAIKHMAPPPHQRDIELILSIYREMFDKIAGIFDMTDPSIAKGRMAFKTVATIIESMHTMLRGKIRGYGKMLRERGRMWLSHAQNWYTEERIFFVNAQAGTKESGKFTGKEMIFPVQLQIIAGSTMPTSRLQQREEAKELHKDGAIDIRELLERIDWPNRAEVIQRMEMGMLGPIIKRMEALQVDPKVIEMLQKIAGMDESEYNAVVNQMKEAQHNEMKGGQGQDEVMQVKGL
jgi:hypothetical protein